MTTDAYTRPGKEAGERAEAVGTDRDAAAGRTASAAPGQTRGPAPVALLAVAAVLIGWAMAAADPHRIGALGIVDALDWRYAAGIVALAAAFVWELGAARPRTWLLASATCALVVAIYGVSPVVEQTSRLPTSWRHAGFINYIHDNGTVLHHYDARFSWPGFFAGVAVLMNTAGVGDASHLLLYASVVFMLAYLPCLAMIFRELGLSRRATWLALWLFLCADWADQEYLSPQGAAYLLSLVVLVIALRTSGRRAPVVGGSTGGGVRGRRDRLRALLDPPPPALGPRQQMALLGCAAVLAFAVVASHQLSPPLLTLLLVSLLLTGRLRGRGLVLLVPILFVGYFTFGAVDFWSGHLSVVTGDVGGVGGTVNQTLSNRVQGSPTHLRIAFLRIVVVGVLFAGAAIGSLRRRRWRLGAVAQAAAIAPFGLLALQSYGGEALLRAYLFALPFLCALCAAAFLPAPDPDFGALVRRGRRRGGLARRRPRARTAGSGEETVQLRIRRARPPRPELSRRLSALLLVVCTGAVAVQLVCRGGNEEFVWFSHEEVAATQELYDLAPTGSTIGVLNGFFPGQNDDLGRVSLINLESKCKPVVDPYQCALQLKPDYILITRAQDAYGRESESRPEKWAAADAASLERSAGYHRIRNSPDAIILAREVDGELRTSRVDASTRPVLSVDQEG
ncbi:MULTISPECIES: hypothetical protein [Frankia]|uniref:hypothetical protein n=1 Tax=Frankia TaxID=1854 RepID=UPI0002EFA13B|nr:MULTISPECIES: hypothetical protein [Frankia]